MKSVTPHIQAVQRTQTRYIKKVLLLRWMEKGGKAPGERQRAPGQRPLWPQDDTVSDDFAFLREKIKPLQPGICLLRIQNIFQK